MDIELKSAVLHSENENREIITRSNVFATYGYVTSCTDLPKCIQC